MTRVQKILSKLKKYISREIFFRGSYGPKINLKKKKILCLAKKLKKFLSKFKKKKISREIFLGVLEVLKIFLKK